MVNNKGEVKKWKIELNNEVHKVKEKMKWSKKKELQKDIIDLVRKADNEQLKIIYSFIKAMQE